MFPKLGLKARFKRTSRAALKGRSFTWHLVCSPMTPHLYSRSSSGSNSAVECDLAKVEVAGSNPVSRSSFLSPAAREGFLFARYWAR